MKAFSKETAPTTDGRVTYHRRFTILDSRIEDFLIQDFDLRLGDLRDDLRRHYLQGYLELKKEEQSTLVTRIRGIPPNQTLVRYEY
ncbi:hypothetical protein M9H77_07187 [Catharanthus roseus]|uniref:Uncharacterized protein n=1 Tax=Catharanthus roseus TaxID=4058 RepID=A0ACC0BU72_CATRO|nr:hypothetical protein M9H77_07187 [Catharanthus roseus]